MNYEGHPIKAIMDLHCICHRAIEQQMADLSLSSIQSRMIGYLYFCSKQGKKVLQRELEAEFKIRKSSVTSVLQTLEKKGLIQRINVEGDARQKQLLLTEKAVALHEIVNHRLEVLEEEVNASMTLEEREILQICVQKIQDRLKEVCK